MAKNSDMQNRGTNGTNEYGMKDCHNSGKNATSQNNAKNATSQNNAKNNAKNSSSQNRLPGFLCKIACLGKAPAPLQ